MSDDRYDDKHDGKDRHDEPEVNIYARYDTAEEGGTLKYEVRIDEAQHRDIVVKYEIKNDTTEDNDYRDPQYGYVTIKAYEYSAEIKIYAKEDDRKEGTEHFEIKLKEGDKYDVGDHKEADGYIKDKHEKPEVSIYGEHGNKSDVYEGDRGEYRELHFWVKLDEKADRPLDVYYHTEDLTTEQNDYRHVEYGKVHFDEGQQWAKIDVKVYGDNYKEDDEYLKVVIDDKDYYKVDHDHDKAIGEIKNDDHHNPYPDYHYS